MPRFESKKKYSKISYTKRVKLIQLAEEQGLGVTKAAKQLRIKIPTAKVILSNYRKKGTIYRKKNDKDLPQPSPRLEASPVKEQHVQPAVIEVPQQTSKLPIQSMSLTPIFWMSQVIPWGGMILF